MTFCPPKKNFAPSTLHALIDKPFSAPTHNRDRPEAISADEIIPQQ